jgi:hypothetical protein
VTLHLPSDYPVMSCPILSHPLTTSLTVPPNPPRPVPTPSFPFSQSYLPILPSAKPPDLCNTHVILLTSSPAFSSSHTKPNQTKPNQTTHPQNTTAPQRTAPPKSKTFQARARSTACPSRGPTLPGSHKDSPNFACPSRSKLTKFDSTVSYHSIKIIEFGVLRKKTSSRYGKETQLLYSMMMP